MEVLTSLWQLVRRPLGVATLSSSEQNGLLLVRVERSHRHVLETRFSLLHLCLGGLIRVSHTSVNFLTPEPSFISPLAM